MLISDYITPVMFTDSTGMFVIAPIGFELQMGGTFGGYLSFWLVIDHHGNVGILFSTGVGAMSPSISLAYSPFISWRDSINDLKGLSLITGLTINRGFSIGGDLLADKDGILGIQANFGIGFSFPESGEGHSFVGYSILFSLNSTDDDLLSEKSIFYIYTEIKKYVKEILS